VSGLGGGGQVVEAGRLYACQDLAGGRVEGLQGRPARGREEGAAVRRARNGPAGRDPERRKDGVSPRLGFVLRLP